MNRIPNQEHTAAFQKQAVTMVKNRKAVSETRQDPDLRSIGSSCESIGVQYHLRVRFPGFHFDRTAGRIHSKALG